MRRSLVTTLLLAVSGCGGISNLTVINVGDDPFQVDMFAVGSGTDGSMTTYEDQFSVAVDSDGETSAPSNTSITLYFTTTVEPTFTPYSCQNVKEYAASNVTFEVDMDLETGGVVVDDAAFTCGSMGGYGIYGEE